MSKEKDNGRQNKAMDRTKRSAGGHTLQSSASGALLLVGHLDRSATRMKVNI
jgi:hypothetical protein